MPTADYNFLIQLLFVIAFAVVGCLTRLIGQEIDKAEKPGIKRTYQAIADVCWSISLVVLVYCMVDWGWTR